MLIKQAGVHWSQVGTNWSQVRVNWSQAAAFSIVFPRSGLALLCFASATVRKWRHGRAISLSPLKRSHVAINHRGWSVGSTRSTLLASTPSLLHVTKHPRHVPADLLTSISPFFPNQSGQLRFGQKYKYIYFWCMVEYKRIWWWWH